MWNIVVCIALATTPATEPASSLTAPPMQPAISPAALVGHALLGVGVSTFFVAGSLTLQAVKTKLGDGARAALSAVVSGSHGPSPGGPLRDYDNEIYITSFVLVSAATGPLVYAFGELLGAKGTLEPTLVGALIGSAATVAPFIWAVDRRDLPLTMAMGAASIATAGLGGILGYYLWRPSSGASEESIVHTLSPSIAPTANNGATFSLSGVF